MREIKWSPTRVDAANYCTMRYYLKYVLRETPLVLPEYLKGKLIHELIENFWKNLGNSGELGKTGGKKYSNAEEFSRYAQRMWNYFCIRTEKSSSERRVAWNYGEERWTIRSNLEKICFHLFPLLVEEGPPVFSELGFKFGAFDRTFSGKIDEVRRKGDLIIVRDYKSGRPFLGEMKLNFDPQLTIYSVALSFLIQKNKDIARRLGFQEIPEELRRNSDYVLPFVRQEFFMVEAPVRIAEGKTGLKAVHETTRTNSHFLEVVRMIDSVQDRINSGNVVAERGRKCDSCDLKYACAKKLGEVGSDFFETKGGQLGLEFAIPLFARKKESRKPKKADNNQKKLKFSYK